MNEHYKQIEHEAADPIRAEFGLPTASVLFHGGSSHVVMYGGVAERELLARGALRIGSVSFQRPARVPAGVVTVGAGRLRGAWGSGCN